MPAKRSTSVTPSPLKFDAIAVLEHDHATLRSLLDHLVHATKKSMRKELLKRIEHEIIIHTQIEEEIFYPSFKEAADAKKDLKIFFEAHEEHHIADVVLSEIKDTKVKSDEFSAKAKVLKDLIEHHAEEEETEMFPRARTLIEEERLFQLGQDLQQRKIELAKIYKIKIKKKKNKGSMKKNDQTDQVSAMSKDSTKAKKNKDAEQILEKSGTVNESSKKASKNKKQG